LIIGQHLTSRTEAIRDYLLNKVSSLYLITFSSFAVNKKENHLFCYDKGELKKHYLFKHWFLNLVRSRWPLIVITFLFYCADIFRSLLILRRKFDLYIGISHFSGLIGVLFKKIGISKRFIYYAIDYYVPHRKEDSLKPFGGVNWFEVILLKLSIYIDNLAVNCADEVWDISSRIEEGRKIYTRLNIEAYRNKRKIVPLGYDISFYRSKGLDEVERYSVVFVGLTLKNQGLELILDIIPELFCVMPGIIVKVIGRGPFLEEFKEMVVSRGLSRYFKFYGFIEDVNEMLDIVSSSAVGVSVWDDKNSRIVNAYYGDPGKTKLYSVCGLPVVVSDMTIYANAISEYKAGVAIEYNKNQFLEGLKEILLNDSDYAVFKANAKRVGIDYCNAEKIFDEVLN